MKKQSIVPFTRLLRKKVCFLGKFGLDHRSKVRRLTHMTEAYQGSVVERLHGLVDYVILEDLSRGKGIQKQVALLRAKGSGLQVLDSDSFKAMLQPNPDEVLSLIRRGAQAAETFNLLCRPDSHTWSFSHESFDGLDLSGFMFDSVKFSECTFVKAKFSWTRFTVAERCDFSGATGEELTTCRIAGSRFDNAKLSSSHFLSDVHPATLNFTHGMSPPLTGLSFKRAILKRATFWRTSIRSANFEEADLSEAKLTEAQFDATSFRCAMLNGATLGRSGRAHSILKSSILTRCDFSNADLRRADLTGDDLTGSRFDGADLEDCNLEGATLDGVDISTARNYGKKSIQIGVIGPALSELDAITPSCRRIQISFMVRRGTLDAEVGIDTGFLGRGWPVRVPHDIGAPYPNRQQPKTFSEAMLQLASMAGNLPVRYETLEVKAKDAPKSRAEMWELAVRGIAEAFAQPLPPDDKLRPVTEAHRQMMRERKAADKLARTEKHKELVKLRKGAEKQRETAKKRLAKKIEKQVGKVTDIATFLKALELRADAEKIKKATKMLKASGFQLYNDVTDHHLSGVVKSQTDPDLVYACRLHDDGTYACCTQNLNICGGLRGSICKHLLVLIIGLVNAGQLDPATIDAWVAKTHQAKPELNKETMGGIFIRYKGAEAGEIDWRPTETLPEDYYSL